MPMTGFQGLLSNNPNASPPTTFTVEWIICSTSTGHCEGEEERGREGGRGGGGRGGTE